MIKKYRFRKLEIRYQDMPEAYKELKAPYENTNILSREIRHIP
jgi:hypothetical protein